MYIVVYLYYYNEIFPTLGYYYNINSRTDIIIQSCSIRKRDYFIRSTSFLPRFARVVVFFYSLA